MGQKERLLEIKKISFFYEQGKPALKDVSLSIDKGEKIAVLGANGAGKSTFLKVLSGEIEPSKGEVCIDKGERLSVLKQDHFAFEKFTVLDTVIMGNQELYRIMKEKEAIYAKEDFGEENVEAYNKGADAVMALKQGKVDAVIIDNQPALSFVKSTDGLKLLETEYAVEDYAAAIAKGNDALVKAVNDALVSLKEDGTIQSIIDKYIVSE